MDLRVLRELCGELLRIILLAISVRMEAESIKLKTES